MRLSGLIAAFAVAVPLALDAAPAAAQPFQPFAGQSILFGRPHGSLYEGRWCLRENTGAESVQENCQFDSFEACRRLAIGGNRGFCTQNPAYAGPPPAPRRYKKQRAQR